MRSKVQGAWDSERYANGQGKQENEEMKGDEAPAATRQEEGRGGGTPATEERPASRAVGDTDRS